MVTWPNVVEKSEPGICWRGGRAGWLQYKSQRDIVLYKGSEEQTDFKKDHFNLEVKAGIVPIVYYTGNLFMSN